jgi:uncharacterized membrane protein YeaQ/YmgE (transglycosylase-associated protein family)
LIADARPLFIVESGLLMGLVLMLGAGLFVGAMTSLLRRREEPGGVATLVALGGVGGLAAGLLGLSVGWYDPGAKWSLLVSVAGAMAMIGLYRYLSRSRLGRTSS